MRTEEETYEIRKLRMIIEVKHKETFRFEDRDEQKYRRALFVCVFFCSHFPGTGTAKERGGKRMAVISGLGLLLVTLAAFSLFSMKAPKGSEAMSGMASAAVATFLVEAVHRYISGDLLGVSFLGEVGSTAGSLGGVAAAIMVVAGAALGGYGILPGFIAGYVVGFVAPLLEKYLPTGLDVIVGALCVAPLARGIAYISDPVVNAAMEHIGSMITAATDQSPVLMGFMLGGLMKMICTSPLSSMALTAMLGLTGLPMGIACIACVGGAFTNGMIFKMLKLGDKSSTIAVMVEPLTQAHIVTKHPIPIYGSNFFGGGVAGIGASLLGIVCNAPGTASPIPGLIAPFAFNSPVKVILALAIGVAGGTLAGYVGGHIFKKHYAESDAHMEG